MVTEHQHLRGPDFLPDTCRICGERTPHPKIHWPENVEQSEPDVFDWLAGQGMEVTGTGHVDDTLAPEPVTVTVCPVCGMPSKSHSYVMASRHGIF